MHMQTFKKNLQTALLLALFAIFGFVSQHVFAQDTLELTLPKGEWVKAILNGNTVYLRPDVPAAEWSEMIVITQAPLSELPQNPGLSKGDLTAKMAESKLQGFSGNRIFKVLEKDNKHVVFEYRIIGADNPLGYGFYGLNHTFIGKTQTLGAEYMTKNPGRLDDLRAEWLPILKKAKISSKAK